MKDLSMHIMDIMQNAINAGCSRLTLTLGLTAGDEYLEIKVDDDGYGMSEEVRKKAVDPFYTSRDSRRIGLGISMFKAAAETSGGRLTLLSEEGKGTSICGLFKNRSIDRQPLGSVGNVILLHMISYPKVRFLLDIYREDFRYSFDSVAMIRKKKAEGRSPMDAAFEAEEIVDEQIKTIFYGGLPEIGGSVYAAQ